MAIQRDLLSQAEHDRIYTSDIRSFFLDSVDRSLTPTAVLVGGQPGAGKSGAIRDVSARLAATSGAPVIISGDELREFHPHWKAHARSDANAARDTQRDAGLWYQRLYREAVALQKNVVFETSMRNPHAVERLSKELRAAAYRVEAVIVAVDRETSRLSTIERYAKQVEGSEIPRFVPGRYHDDAYDSLRDTVKAIDRGDLVDKVLLVTRDGSDAFSNEREGARWSQPPRALRALDAQRERRPSAKQLAENVERWHGLTALLQVRGDRVARDVLEQAIAWRKEASARALANPAAAKLYRWALAAEAYVTMPREQFLREFPSYRSAIEKRDQAGEYASKQYAHDPQAQRRFTEQAGDRIAQQIREGRQFGRVLGGDERSR